MSTELRAVPSRSPRAGLTIGALAERTGVAVQTLRMWESRHGFPEPQRLLSGHRRFTEDDVTQVRSVVRMRENGSRLDAAIASVRDRAEEDEHPRSVYAVIRDKHPGLPAQRLRKSTLRGLSWAIEDDFCAKAESARVFGAFEETAHYLASEERWTELATAATSAHVFAGFDTGLPTATPPTHRGPWPVALAIDHPMRREWAVVCDSQSLPVALTAWELPGQRRVRGLDRIFEAVWTVDPVAVRDAARVCASIAAAAGAPSADEAVAALAPPARTGHADLAAISRLVGRIVTYVDRGATTRS